MLDKEYKFYQANKSKLDKKYKNKFIVIVGENILGPYLNEEEAYKNAQMKYPVGAFLIQKCGKSEQVVQTFHSRIVFC